MQMNKFLTRREINTLLSFASVVIPEGGAIPYSFKDISLIDFAEEFLAEAPWHVRWLIRLNLWVLEYLSWLLVGRPLLFSRTSPYWQNTIICRIRSSRFFFVRGIYLFTALFVLIPYYNDKRVLKHIGYHP